MGTKGFLSLWCIVIGIVVDNIVFLELFVYVWSRFVLSSLVSCIMMICGAFGKLCKNSQMMVG